MHICTTAQIEKLINTEDSGYSESSSDGKTSVHDSNKE